MMTFGDVMGQDKKAEERYIKLRWSKNNFDFDTTTTTTAASTSTTTTATSTTTTPATTMKEGGGVEVKL